MSSVPLHSRHFGGAGNPPLVILHGLLGSSRNWQTVGRELASRFDVYALDLRNHGESSRSDVMDYPELAADVAAWMDAHGLRAAHLLGHSMGGKTAMRFAMDFPERLLSLTVVDIAPRDYDWHHRSEFAAMLAMDLPSIRDRRGAEAALEPAVPDWAMRQFLLTNLVRGDDGAFSWGVNLRVLADSLPIVSATPLAPSEVFCGPVLFVKGGASGFIRPEDIQGIRAHFPAAVLAEMPGSGHNPHMDDRIAFVRLLMENITP